MPDQVIATYRDGQIVFDAPVVWPSGTRVIVSPAAKDICGDGTPWPETKAEIETWLARWEQLEPLHLSPEELRRLDDHFAATRAEQKALTQQNWEAVEKLF